MSAVYFKFVKVVHLLVRAGAFCDHAGTQSDETVFDLAEMHAQDDEVMHNVLVMLHDHCRNRPKDEL
jgi:hypothetical protein